MSTKAGVDPATARPRNFPECRRDIGHFDLVVAIDDLQVALFGLNELSEFKRTANQPDIGREMV